MSIKIFETCYIFNYYFFSCRARFLATSSSSKSTIRRIEKSKTAKSLEFIFSLNLDFVSFLCEFNPSFLFNNLYLILKSSSNKIMHFLLTGPKHDCPYNLCWSLADNGGGAWGLGNFAFTRSSL